MNELTPITNRKQSLQEMMTDIKTKAWVFESKWEKIIVTAAILWGAYSILRFLFFLIF